MSPPVAKISPPLLQETFPRRRLFRLLDEAAKKPVVWLSAPAGSGKTTLIASWLDYRKLTCLWYQIDQSDADIATFFYYMGLAAKRAFPRSRKSLPLLTPEYLQGLPVFSRRYFDILYGKLKTPFALVLDNYQDVPPDSAFHEIMREGLSALPDGISVVLVSRGEPPPAFARLRASNMMSFVGWSDVRFNIDETKTLLLNQRPHLLSDEALKVLYTRTEGWAAGIVLMLERMKRETYDPAALPHLAREEVFNYFAGELFEKAEKETRDFLLSSAFLPSMTAGEAQELTGNHEAATILAGLNRIHFFTERHLAAEPVYQYHPLFREFLLFRAESTLPAEKLMELRNSAAALLERSGRVEPAAELMCRAGDWPGLARLVGSHARDFIAQGRIRTLEGWLGSFPEGYAEQFPWLEYWLGACGLPFNPAEIRHHFARAFELFKKENDAAGQYLAWAGIADSIYYAWSDYARLDRWLKELDELLQRHPVFPSVEIEVLVSNSVFGGLLFRNPVHDRLAFWEKRLDRLVHTITDSRLRIIMGGNLVHYYVLVGDFAKAARLIDALQAPHHVRDLTPLALLIWNSSKALYSWHAGEFEGCRKIVAENLKTAETVGIHLLDVSILSLGAAGALSAGELSAGAELLGRINSLMDFERQGDVSFYHHLAGWEAALREDIPRALDHVRLSLSLTEKWEMLFPQALNHVALAQLTITLGKYPEASHSIEMARRIGHDMGSSAVEVMCLMAAARLALDQNDEIGGLAALSEGFALAKKIGLVNHSWWLPQVMARLCAKALEEGIEVDYVQQLVRKRHLLPPASRMAPENWPWPVRIYTLGRFALLIDGKAPKNGFKSSQKPLLLLKALLALGGRDLKAENLSYLLWPDADGDAGHNVFTTTLARLRSLLGDNRAVHLHDGRVSLDPRFCWVDRWAFERLCSRTAAALEQFREGKADYQEIQEPAERAIRLYGGHFLRSDGDESWTFAPRESLRSKHLRLVGDFCRHLARQGRHQEASRHYQKGLEVDPLAEEFYQGLLEYYLRLGRHAEALQIYHQCRHLLRTELGIAPSPGTEALRDRLPNPS
jgi:ATP/maltotriose-dependent transcriptional regulator MalT/DNA-binding SARP family transcriptional activator